MKTEYQYIQFEEQDRMEGYTTDWWLCKNRRHGTALGVVVWERGWRQYIFQSDNDIIFSAGCLRDIAHFIEQVTNVHREIVTQRKNRLPYFQSKQS